MPFPAMMSLLVSFQRRDRRSEGDAQPMEEGAETLELSFPVHLIGCIIGRGGSKICEIQQISGSRIVIAQLDGR